MKGFDENFVLIQFSFQAAVSGTLHEPKTNDSSEDDDHVLSGLTSSVHHSDYKTENKYLSSVDSGKLAPVKKDCRILMSYSILDSASRANSSLKKSLHPNKKIRHK